MTHGRTVLCHKDQRRDNAVANYCPVTCLPLVWKLLTVMIAEEMYDYLEQEKLLPEEQRVCTRGSHRQRINYLLIERIQGKAPQIIFGLVVV